MTEIATREQHRTAQQAAQLAEAAEADPTVVQAKQAADKAAQALTDLEQRILAGDTKVTTTQTITAREAATLAQLRVDAARRQATEDIAAGTAKAKADAVDQALTALQKTHGPDVIQAAAAKVQKAIDAYRAVIAAQHEAFDQAAAHLAKNGTPRVDPSIITGGVRPLEEAQATNRAVLTGQSYSRRADAIHIDGERYARAHAQY